MSINKQRLSSPNEQERASYASELRERITRSRKTVLKRTYSYIDPEQDPEALQALLLLATDHCDAVRASAAYALGDHPSEPSHRMLQSLLNDSAPRVCEASRHAIERIQENDKTIESLNMAIEEHDQLKASGKLQTRFQEIHSEEQRKAAVELELVRSHEGRILQFIVQGSRPYNIKACRSQDRFMIECNCPAGQENMLCKHILWLLEGETNCLLSANPEEAAILPLLIKGTPASEHYSFALGWLPESKKAFKIATQF